MICNDPTSILSILMFSRIVTLYYRGAQYYYVVDDVRSNNGYLNNELIQSYIRMVIFSQDVPYFLYLNCIKFWFVKKLCTENSFFSFYWFYYYKNTLFGIYNLCPCVQLVWFKIYLELEFSKTHNCEPMIKCTYYKIILL